MLEATVQLNCAHQVINTSKSALKGDLAAKNSNLPARMAKKNLTFHAVYHIIILPLMESDSHIRIIPSITCEID